MGNNPNPYGGGDSGGVGGRRRKIQTNVPRGKTSHAGGGGGHKKKGCCPMVAAVRSVRQGRFRLAGRYALWSVRLIGQRMVGA